MEKAKQDRASRTLVFIQFLLGLGAYLLFVLPYMRKMHGLKRLRRGERYLFVVNHVSLLDTILIGALCWRTGFYPILVLGDKNVWQASLIKRLLSSRIGFLLERGKINPDRIRELQTFARSSSYSHLVVYPEGTRGDGVRVARCQPGVYYIAQEARVPIVPVFIANMQLVSTKSGAFHPFAGFRKIEVHFGEPILPETYLSLPREDFTEFIRQQIGAVRTTQPAERSNTVPLSA